MAKDTQTEGAILNAAREVFIKKGYAGARMQEIADAAGINKALLHYYYRNKEQLFANIFTSTLEKIIPFVNKIFVSDKNLFETIADFVSVYVDFLMAHPYLPAFILHELSQNADNIPQLIGQMEKRPDSKSFINKIEKAIAANEIRPVKPTHLLVNIISLCILPVAGKPLLQAMIGITEKKYEQLLQERKTEITQFVFNAMKIQ